MKFLCPSCERIAPAAAFRTEHQTLWLRCARCGEENALELESQSAMPKPAPVAVPTNPPPPAPVLPVEPSAPASPRVLPLRAVSDAVKLAAEAAQAANPFEVPADRCPKCIGARDPDALICPHCGLAFINFRPEESEPSPEVSAAFRRALEAWDVPERHEEVLTIATRRGELAAVGRLYRIRLVAAPLDPVAQRGRDEVLRRASASSDMLRTIDAREPRPPRWQYFAVAILGVGVLALLGVLLKQML